MARISGSCSCSRCALRTSRAAGILTSIRAAHRGFADLRSRTSQKIAKRCDGGFASHMAQYCCRVYYVIDFRGVE